MLLTVLSIADAVCPLLYDHFDAERWKKIDLVLSAGDLPPDYLDFLTTALGVPVIYVRGNHDARYPAALYDGLENAHGRIVECKGLRIAGLEGSMRYSGGACQYTEGEMAATARRLRREAQRKGNPHIVLTHAAPTGIHDAEDLCHRGFLCFRELIDEWMPAYFIHGHMHNYNRGPSVSTVGETTVINAYPYHVFEIPVVEAKVAPVRRWQWLRNHLHVPVRPVFP